MQPFSNKSALAITIGTAMRTERILSGNGFSRTRPGIVSHHKAKPRETA
jgi:hypothetical protein